MATQAAFLTFVRTYMGINTTVLPDSSPDIANAYNFAIDWATDLMQKVSTTASDQMYYNLAGHYLVANALDQTGQTCFADLRKSFDLNGFVPGVVQSTGDQGTSESLTVPEFFNTFQMSDLDMAKTPWGRNYLMYAQKTMYTWGLT